MLYLTKDNRITKLLCFFLVLALLVCIAGMGHRAKAAFPGAVTLSLGILAVLVLAYCAASGITFDFMGKDAPTGQSDVEGLIEDYVAEEHSGSTWQQVFGETATAATGIGGKFVLGFAIANAIRSFVLWLQDKYDITDGSTTVIQPAGEFIEGTLGNYQVIASSSVSEYNNAPVKPVPAFAFTYGVPSDQFITFGDRYIRVVYYIQNGNYHFITTYYGLLSNPEKNDNYKNYGVSREANGAVLNVYFNKNQTDGHTEFYRYIILNSSGTAIRSGGGAYYNIEQPLTQEGGLTVSGDVIGIPLPAEEDESIVITVPGVGTYDTFDDAIDTTRDLAITGELAATAEITKTEELEDEIIDYPALSDDYGVERAIADVFPFCIPFDIFYFVQTMSAGRKAPSFEIPLDFGEAGSSTVTIDLTPFDTVAGIMRIMELLAFCVGLAMGTRKLIKW